MYDVTFGKTVVMTVTEIHAATRLAEALNDATQYGFQTEGLSSHVEEVERGQVLPDPEEVTDDDVYYQLNSGDASAFIRGHENVDDVRSFIITERSHPRYDGGRSGVLDDAEEYLGELLT